jgi:hypothetical protein
MGRRYDSRRRGEKEGTMHGAKMLVRVLLAGLFSGCAGALITVLSLSALLFVLVLSGMEPHPPQDWYYLPLLYFRLFSVPAGVLGFLCGIFVRSYLVLRSRHITSRVRLIAEAAVMGALLSTFLPHFLLLIREGRFQGWFDWRVTLFLIVVFCSVTILYAVAVHPRLETGTSESQFARTT